MSFLLACPNCGPRAAHEFRYGGELNPRPSTSRDDQAAPWAEYLYFHTNIAGVQDEWWYHRAGCQRWFHARRDTRSNQVLRTNWASAVGQPEEQPVQGPSIEP